MPRASAQRGTSRMSTPTRKPPPGPFPLAAPAPPAGAHRAAAISRHILSGEASNARRDFDGNDPGVCMRRAHDRAVQLARQDEVGDETSAAFEEATVLDPL